MSRMKHKYRRLTPEEFSKLRELSEMSLQEFLKITGRSYDQVSEFLRRDATDDRRSFTPTMGDAIILELCARDPGIVDEMLEIAEQYKEV